MDGRQHEIVLIETRSPGEITRGVRRIECQLGDETLARRILSRQQLQLLEITQPRVEMLVQTLEVRAIPLAHHIDLTRPRPLRIGECQHELNQALPDDVRSLRRRLETLERLERVPARLQ